MVYAFTSTYSPSSSFWDAVLGFLIGIVYGNVMSKDYIASMGIFNEFFLTQYSQAEIDVMEYMWYVIRVRVVPLVLVAALGCTRLRKDERLIRKYLQESTMKRAPLLFGHTERTV